MENNAPELLSPSADLVAAFSNAQPVAVQPEPQAPQPAPEAPEQPADVPAPAPVEGAVVEPATNPAPAVVEPAPAPDYTAWLRETYGVEPDSVKAALDNQPKVAEWQKAAEAATAVRELLADPVKLREFADLTTQDFGKLAQESPKDVLLAQFKASKPGMPADVAATLFEREFSAKYPGLNYDDPDDAAFQSDSRILAYEAAEAAKFMEGKQAEARKVLEAPAPESVAPAGPTPEETEAQLQQVEDYFKDLDGFDFDVEGQKVSMPITNAESLKAATLDFGGFITSLVTTNGKYDPEKAAMAAYKLTEDVATHAAKAAKGSAGPVVPMAALTNNPAAGAPAAAQNDQAELLSAFRASTTGSGNW